MSMPLEKGVPLPDLVPTNPHGQKISAKQIEESFRYCLFLARNHYENFPVASLIVPKNLRPYIAAVYAFARIADDFADEKSYEGLRLDLLKAWENELKNIFVVPPTHPVFIALRETISRFKIPISLFYDLLTAFKMDVMVKRYQDFEQILNYCRYSANPVGRIVLYIMGYPAPTFLEYSDYICTALQLANFWQDVAIDLEKDRIYLPLEDMQRFGLYEENITSKHYSAQFKKLLTFEVHRTLELFERGKPLIHKIPGRFGLELRLTWHGGTTILRKILSCHCNVFEHRPRLGLLDVPLLLLKSIRKK